MRILELHINSPFKNLEGFKIDFNSASDVTVILGRNGAAKSNLLEAIITIFRDIDLRKKALFAYSMTYEMKGQIVRLNAECGKSPVATVDNKKVKLAEVNESWAPRYVVGYYSGLSDRFVKLFWRHDGIALDQTLKAKDSDTVLDFRRFVNARPEHGLFALLAFYFSPEEEVIKFLNDLPRIISFDSVLIAIRKPEWARRGSTALDFWGAKGPVKNLLDRLRQHSLAPLNVTSRIHTGFRQSTNRELVYLYLPDLNALHSFASQYGSDSRQLFQALDTMRLSGLLEDFRVRVKVRGSDASIHTRELSEGEQQLLTVLGLMRFTRNDSSLYLLDEPDTHLNPSWGLEYLRRLREIGEIDAHSHTFIATHDPLLVAGLEKEEIRVLIRNENGCVLAMEPEESPKGRGVAAALTSELFGLESQLDLDAQETLKEIYRITEKEVLNETDKLRLRELRAKIPDLVPEDTEGDPYRALAQRAFEEAQDLILNSNGEMNWKRSALDRLRELITSEVQPK